MLTERDIILTKEEILRQITNIKYRLGGCPKNILCAYCICQPLLSDEKGCNPSNAIEYIKQFEGK